MFDLNLVAWGSSFWYVLIVGLTAFLVIAASTVLLAKCFVTTHADQAIVRTGMGGTSICFDRAIVIPFFQQFEMVPTLVQKLRYERTGDWALDFKCGTRVELVADLLVRVNRDSADVKRAVSFLGISRLNCNESLREHFDSMFNDSLDSIAGQSEYEEFASDKDSFREKLVRHIGIDLNGMVTDDICIHHLRRV